VSDGDLIIAAGNDHQYRKLCEALGADELGSDPRFAVSRDRVARRDELTAILHALTRQFTRAALLEKLDALGVPAGPINSVGEVFADPQIIARGMALKIENPLAASGFTPGVRAPIVMDGQALCAPLPAPGLGQHNDDVLADVNWGG
jgi:crotonobetainyl-CoA:carnitine CoA-transferase CaiB-like acyl-CoA transferase